MFFVKVFRSGSGYYVSFNVLIDLWSCKDLGSWRKCRQRMRVFGRPHLCYEKLKMKWGDNTDQ